MTDLSSARQKKDDFFKNDRHSPLTRAQKQHFQGLRYFPENPALALELPLEPCEPPQPVTLQTSSGEVREYERCGRFQFSVEGQAVELTLYRSDSGYFLPFVDALANQETYGAGRYLEPEPLGNGRFRVDFNYAYNPYCAYNENWSCPLTPPENRLKAPLRAGEQVFHP